MIYHLLTKKEWEARRDADEVATPGAEGFVHCCDEHQVGPVRSQWFDRDIDVVALRLDPTTLAAETRYEPGSLGEDERFPHVYGNVRSADVLSVIDLEVH